MSDPILYCSKCFQHFGYLKKKSLTETHAKCMSCNGDVKIHKPVYVAVFLTEKSKELLLTKVPPVHPTVYGEHMTLAFGRHMLEEYPLGEEIPLIVNNHFKDERGQCVDVWCPGARDIKWKEQQLHITISCAEGVKPFYSAELLKDGTKKNPLEGLPLTGVVDYHPRLKT